MANATTSLASPPLDGGDDAMIIAIKVGAMTLMIAMVVTMAMMIAINVAMSLMIGMVVAMAMMIVIKAAMSLMIDMVVVMAMMIAI